MNSGPTFSEKMNGVVSDLIELTGHQPVSLDTGASPRVDNVEALEELNRSPSLVIQKNSGPQTPQELTLLKQVKLKKKELKMFRQLDAEQQVQQGEPPTGSVKQRDELTALREELQGNQIAAESPLEKIISDYLVDKGKIVSDLFQRDNNRKIPRDRNNSEDLAA